MKQIIFLCIIALFLTACTQTPIETQHEIPGEITSLNSRMSEVFNYTFYSYEIQFNLSENYYYFYSNATAKENSFRIYPVLNLSEDEFKEWTTNEINNINNRHYNWSMSTLHKNSWLNPNSKFKYYSELEMNFLNKSSLILHKDKTLFFYDDDRELSAANDINLFIFCTPNLIIKERGNLYFAYEGNDPHVWPDRDKDLTYDELSIMRINYLEPKLGERALTILDICKDI